ncbi:PAS domain S-box protein [Haloglomus litoreum]|uniref:hybrid sensor histidine kinase/response regulator n=1 Tax=Haloglomus litoreum TaxID=3034026 RepID=UPI0023E8ACEF|nr:PAS domain S-box protein [Haloglomus sp. DT116]
MSGTGEPLFVADGERDRIEVLHVEDDPAFATVARRFLERCDPSLEVTSETDPREALDRLEEESFDCVLCDYDMPGMNGIELLESLRESYPELPFILFTGKGSEEVASDAFSAGATDYFGKSSDASEYEVLAERIATVVEKYRTERQLERSEERYRRLVETAPVAIAVHRGDEIAFANRAAADFLGVDAPAELIGDDPLSYLDTDDRAVARERIARLLADEATMESLEERYVDADGNLKHGLVAGSAVEYGGERAVQVIVRDITEHRERQQELERYRQLVEAMGDGVYALDADGCFEMFNERMVELSGYSREELQGRYAGDVMTEAGLETVEAAIQSLLDGETDSVTVEVQAKRADGEVVPRELTLTLQPTEPGESFAGTVGVVHDITDRVKRERELEAQNERLEAFAEIVSHDLRNPLTVVEGHVELARELAEEGASGEELVPQLEAIADATDRMLSMTGDLLTLSRQGDTVGERHPVALAPLARDVWSTLDTGAATLETRDPGQVEADRTRLEQLLANLLENAVEHGSTDGQSSPDDPVETPADGADEGLTVTVVGTADGFAVTDDGPGVPQEDRDDVFERGYSTEQGTGVGLAIVRTVAEAHGWTVTVGESAAGGARFEFHTDG